MNTKDKALENKKVIMKRSEFLKEHKHLLRVLKTGKGEKKEFNKQTKELKKYA